MRNLAYVSTCGTVGQGGKRGEPGLTIHANGMFFKLRSVNSRTRMRLVLPGPVKKALRNLSDLSFHAATPAPASRRCGTFGTTAERMAIWSSLELAGAMSARVISEPID
jgi:hypothetical protein